MEQLALELDKRTKEKHVHEHSPQQRRKTERGGRLFNRFVTLDQLPESTVKPVDEDSARENEFERE